MLHDMVQPDRDMSELCADDRDLVMYCRDTIKTLGIGTHEHHYELKMTLIDGFSVVNFGTADYVGVREDSVILADFKFAQSTHPLRPQ